MIQKMGNTHKIMPFCRIICLVFVIVGFSACFSAEQEGQQQGQSVGQPAPKTEAVPGSNTQSGQGIYPKPMGWVNDYAEMLTPEEKQQLTQRIGEYEKETTGELAFVLVHDYPNKQFSFKDWLTNLGNEWGVGKSDTNNGILIGVSEKTKEISIVTGLGVEDKMTDAKCQKLINQNMIPLVKKGEVHTALNYALDVIFQEVK